MRKLSRIFLLAIAVVTAGCVQRGGATGMLPDVPNTKTVEGQTITQSIGKLANGAALASGNPELMLVINRIETALVCYQNIGAVAVRTYTDQTFPLSAGLVAIVDRNAVTNPANLAACLTNRGPLTAQQQPTIQPCSKSYTLKKGDNEFYISYIASTQQMCDAFCSGLEGCTK